MSCLVATRKNHSITRAQEHGVFKNQLQARATEMRTGNICTRHISQNLKLGRGLQGHLTLPQSLSSLSNVPTKSLVYNTGQTLTKHAEQKSLNPCLPTCPHTPSHSIETSRQEGPPPRHTAPACSTQDVSFDSRELTHDSCQWLAVSHTQTHCLTEPRETRDLHAGKGNRGAFGPVSTRVCEGP